MVQPNLPQRPVGAVERASPPRHEVGAASRKVLERKSIRWHLVFYAEVTLGLVVAWALLALVSYLTDPQVLAFESWFR